MICRRTKCVYTQIIEGQIVYRLMKFAMDQTTYVRSCHLMNHLSGFPGGYKYVQVNK
jgi:hypothetical protein